MEKALANLKRANALSAEGIRKLSDGKLRELIKVAGYYNQKARYVKEFTKFFEKLRGRTPEREELLAIRGIGPETADSMLLYAYKVPSFVVDAYTRRIFSNLGMIGIKDQYDSIKDMFEKGIEQNLQVYQEFHALIVEHAKRYYQKREKYGQCPLLSIIGKSMHQSPRG